MFFEEKRRLDCVLEGVVGDAGSVLQLIPQIQVDIRGIDLTIEDVKVEEAIRNFIDTDMATKMKVSFTWRPF